MCTVGADGGAVFATGRVVDLPGVAPRQHRDLLLHDAAGTQFLTGRPLGSVEGHRKHGWDGSNYSNVMKWLPVGYVVSTQQYKWLRGKD